MRKGRGREERLGERKSVLVERAAVRRERRVGRRVVSVRAAPRREGGTASAASDDGDDHARPRARQRCRRLSSPRFLPPSSTAPGSPSPSLLYPLLHSPTLLSSSWVRPGPRQGNSATRAMADCPSACSSSQEGKGAKGRADRLPRRRLVGRRRRGAPDRARRPARGLLVVGRRRRLYVAPGPGRALRVPRPAPRGATDADRAALHGLPRQPGL